MGIRESLSLDGGASLQVQAHKLLGTWPINGGLHTQCLYRLTLGSWNAHMLLAL